MKGRRAPEGRAEESRHATGPAADGPAMKGRPVPGRPATSRPAPEGRSTTGPAPEGRPATSRPSVGRRAVEGRAPESRHATGRPSVGGRVVEGRPVSGRGAKRVLGLVAVAALFVGLSGCEELLFAPEPENTPMGIFNQVWTFADREYSFFDYKNIDWDEKRTEYSARIRADMSDQELFDVLAGMLFELRDGHVNLKSDFDRSRYWQWYLDAPPNYDFSVLERHYFNGEQRYVGPFIVHEFRDPGADVGQAVGYVHYRSFGSGVRAKDMSYVIEAFKNHKGLIIDVRNNGGGSLSNVFTIADRLTDRRLPVAEEQIKSGPGHEDFSAKETLYLEPPEGASTFTKPIYVLTNGKCYSATNYFVAVVRELPHVTILGAKTGGGGGIPSYTILSNGWQLRVSSSRLFVLDHSGAMSEDERNVEGGIDPDVPVTSPEAELANGQDRILDEAIALIKGL
jgi:hypothetical protein